MKPKFLKTLMVGAFFFVALIGFMNMFMTSKWKKVSMNGYKEVRVLKINPNLDKEGYNEFLTFHVWLIRGFSSSSKEKKQISIDLEDESDSWDSGASSVFAMILWWLIFLALGYGVYSFELPLDTPMEWITVIVGGYMLLSGFGIMMSQIAGTPIWVAK